jgi:hypothetical protein
LEYFIFLSENLKIKQEVLGTTDCLLAFDATWTAKKVTSTVLRCPGCGLDLVGSG